MAERPGGSSVPLDDWEPSELEATVGAARPFEGGHSEPQATAQTTVGRVRRTAVLPPSKWELGRGPCRSHHPTTLQFIPSRFRDIEPIGQGGAGRVVRAHDTWLDRKVALKLLTSSSHAQPPIIEGKLQARVDHPEICTIHEVLEVDGRWILVMEYVPGQPINRVVQQDDPRSIAQAGVRVARVLAAAHRAGIVHRDIKPGNILAWFDPNGQLQLKLLDFGIATGHTAGSRGVDASTLEYASPEQLRNSAGTADPRTDIFGLGATLYALFSGKTVRTGEQALAIRQGAPAHRPPHLKHDLGLAVSWELAEIVMRCVEPVPGERYPSMGALADDLEAWLRGDPVSVGMDRPAVYLRHWIRANRRRIAAGLAGVMLIASASALTAWKHREERRLGRAIWACGEQARLLRSELATAMMAPFHDTAADRRRVRFRIAELERWLTKRRWGSAAQPWIRAALADAHLAMDEPGRALRILEPAATMPRDAAEQAAASRAEAHIRLLEKAWLSRPSILGQDTMSHYLRSAARDDILAAERALGSAAASRAPGLRLLRARYLLASGDLDGAFSATRDCPDTGWPAVPWHLLRARIHHRRAMELWRSGATASAVAALRTAAADLGEARAIARSESQVYDELCGVWTDRLWIAVQNGSAEAVQHARGLADAACAKARTVNTASPTPTMLSAILAYREAEWLHYYARNGANETELLRQAVALSHSCLQRFPPLLHPYIIAAMSYRAIGRHLYYYDETDPNPAWRRALDLAREAANRFPDDPLAHLVLGAVARDLADTPSFKFHPSTSPLDFSHAARLAADSLSRALEIEGDLPSAWKDLSYLCCRVASRTIFSAPQRAQLAAELGVSCAREAIRVQPAYYDALDNLAEARVQEARAVFVMGGDPMPHLEKAIQAFERDHRTDPARPYPTLYEIGLVRARVFYTFLADRPLAPWRRDFDLLTERERSTQAWRFAPKARCERAIIRAVELLRGLDRQGDVIPAETEVSGLLQDLRSAGPTLPVWGSSLAKTLLEVVRCRARAARGVLSQRDLRQLHAELRRLAPLDPWCSPPPMIAAALARHFDVAERLRRGWPLRDHDTELRTLLTALDRRCARETGIPALLDAYRLHVAALGAPRLSLRHELLDKARAAALRAAKINPNLRWLSRHLQEEIASDLDINWEIAPTRKLSPGTCHDPALRQGASYEIEPQTEKRQANHQPSTARSTTNIIALRGDTAGIGFPPLISARSLARMASTYSWKLET